MKFFLMTDPLIRRLKLASLVLASLLSLSLPVKGWTAEPIFPLQVDDPSERDHWVAAGTPNFGIGKHRIFEESSIEKIMRYVDSDTLFVADVDNTVLKSSLMLGSEPSGPYFLHQALARGEDFQRAFERNWEIFARLREYPGTSELVDPLFPKLLKQKQDAGTRAIALSAAKLSFLDTREKELARHGVDFKLNPISRRSVTLYPGYIGFDRGIMLTTFQDKGASLVGLMQKLGWLPQKPDRGIIPSNQEWRPKKVVFIDDNLKLNIQVAKALTEYKVPHMTFRYGKADRTWAEFDGRLADLELDYFERCKKVLNDAEALKAHFRSEAAGKPARVACRAGS